MKRILLIITIFATLFVMTDKTEVDAHYKVYGKLNKASSHPFFYYKPSSGGKSIPSSWRNQIDRAVASWGAQSSNVFLYPTSSSTQSRFYVSDYVNGIAECLTFGGTSAHNYFYIRYSSDRKFSTSGSNKYNVNTVALHEIGHALGLDHVGNVFSLPDTRAHIMYYTYNTHKSLHSHDIQGLRSIYGR